ncbi:unnamed protein product [Auanema sp. JU1783]|nr:unnamed protein product [Auanema sp. JU1783]
MSAIRKELQRQVFQGEDERLHTMVQILKTDGKKKKRPTFLCIAVTIEHPISVRLYFVRAEKDDSFKKKDRYNLRELRAIDGVNPKKALPDFVITFNERTFSLVAASVEEKEEFIKELYRISSHYLPVQMPDFSDFRVLLDKHNLTVGDSDVLSDILSNHLQSLDGANINSMLSSETAVGCLLTSLNSALGEVDNLTEGLKTCDSIFVDVRNSFELMEEKDSLAIVERKNRYRLRQELMNYVSGLDAVTDAHIRTLEESRFDDPKSIASCAEAARAVSQFWNGHFARPLLNMSSYKERSSLVDITDLFVDRLLSHLSALFNNLNDISMTSDWHSLCIPKQSQRFHALSPLSELILWLKHNKPAAYSVVMQRYVDATKQLYKKLFDQFFEQLHVEINKLSYKRSESTANSAKLSVASSISFPDTSNEFEEISKLIETVLGELGPVVDCEQKFCLRFFHITTDLLMQAEVVSTGSGDSSTLGSATRSIEKTINEQIRAMMGPIFDSLNEHLKKFADVICKQTPSNVLVLFVILSKKILSPQDSGSYFAVTFGTLVVLVKRQLDFYMENERRVYTDIKLTKKVRVGILPSIMRFQSFVIHAESIFKDLDRRTDIEKWYSLLCRSVIEGIQKVAWNSSNKSPPNVVLFENYHQLYLSLSELRLPCLDDMRKLAKKEKEEQIMNYVRDSLGKPLEKVHIFFENITNAITFNGIRPEEISYQPQFSRPELKKVISLYPGKEVKKGLELLYRKLEKHLGENSSLLQVVWREFQEQFIKQLQGYQLIMTDCYPGAKVDLDVSIDDILSFFSCIAQQH